MLEVNFLNKNDFFSRINNAKPYMFDKKELLDLGYISLLDFYKKNHRFDTLYILYEEKNHPVCTIGIQRDGFLNIFFTDKINGNLLKRILNSGKNLLTQFRNCRSFFIRVPSWYKKAHKNAQKLGFKPYKIDEFETIYYWSSKWVVQEEQ